MRYYILDIRYIISIPQRFVWARCVLQAAWTRSPPPLHWSDSSPWPWAAWSSWWRLCPGRNLWGTRGEPVGFGDFWAMKWEKTGDFTSWFSRDIAKKWEIQSLIRMHISWDISLDLCTTKSNVASWEIPELNGVSIVSFQIQWTCFLFARCSRFLLWKSWILVVKP